MKKLFLIPLVSLLLSCSEEASDINIDLGYDFLPVQTGNFWTYEVQEITYEVFEPDTSVYFIKDVVVDSIIPSDSQSVKYIMYRYSGEDSSSLALDSVWSLRLTDRVAVFSENNQDVIKLTFPVEAGNSWDGNAYNTEDSETFYYESVDDYTYDDVSYSSDDAIRVIIEDVEQNLVNQDERSEVYLKNVGLVEKDYTQLSFCTVNCETKGSEVGEIEKGTILSQKLIVYGKK